VGETKDQVTSHVRKRPGHKLGAEAPEAPDAKLAVLRELPNRYRQSPGIYLLAAALGGDVPHAKGGGARSLAFEAIKGALIGVAASEAKSVFQQMMSGVTRHLTNHTKSKQAGGQRRVHAAHGST
jgi:hypothetical protein